MTGGPYLPPEMRRTLGGQVFEEMLRVDPQLRAIYARPGAGAVSLSVRPEDMGAVLDTLRALPDDAGGEAARAALAPYRVEEPPITDDGSAWRNRTPYRVGPDFDRRAAEATLLALRFMLPLPEEGRGLGYAILPHPVPTHRREVVEHLMSLAKPVASVALGLGGILAVGAWTTEPPREGTPGVFERIRANYLEILRKNYGDREARGLLVGQGEELVMTAEEIAEWREQYDVLGLTSWWDAEDPLTRERGVDFVVRFKRMRVGEPDPEFDEQ